MLCFQWLMTLKLQRILLIILIGFLANCSVVKTTQQGIVYPNNFDYSGHFEIIKSVVVLPCNINGKSKNFIFDTGADFSVVQRDTMLGTISSYKGASKRKMLLGSETLTSLKVGSVTFKATQALNGNLVGLKEQIPNFGGLIGKPIINKANWLIDYSDKKIRVTNKNILNTSFKPIRVSFENGTYYTFVTVNEKEYKVIIDTGSSTAFNIPNDSELAKALLKNNKFRERSRDRYTLGGLHTVTEQVGYVGNIRIGEKEFNRVFTTINTSSQPRIGISFFKDYKLYIDHISKGIYIKKTSA